MSNDNGPGFQALERWPILVLTALTFALASVSSVHAAGTVTNCTAYGSPGTPGDLAWALQGGGTVAFACSGTIVVPEIGLSHDTIIDGAGHSVALSGARVNRVLRVNAGVTVQLMGITVTDGATAPDAGAGENGGGIYNEGSLTLTNSTVSRSSAVSSGGGIYNRSGSLTLTNSTVSANSARTISYSYFSTAGGGIFNVSGGTVTLTNSTVSGNSADYGGGIGAFSGSLTLTNSTVSGNVARVNSTSYAGGYGGGIYTSSDSLALTNSTVSGNHAVSRGGGILNSGGSLTLTNSTVSGNSTFSGGGGIDNSSSGVITLTSSTVTDNSTSHGVGAGIANDGSVTVTNSIIAQQRQSGDCDGAVTSGGYNLDSDGTCNLTAPGDISGGVADLLPLAVNAPGATATHAPGPMSQARDAIPPGTNGCGTAITTDQRGVARPQGVGCDIGSHEWMLAVQMSQTITVTAPAPPSAPYGATFTVTAAASSGLPVAITTTGSCSGGGSHSAAITMTSGIGTCTLHYNQAGNEQYYPAPEVTSETEALPDTVTIRRATFVNIVSTLFVSAISTSTAVPYPVLYVTVPECLEAVRMVRKPDAGAYVLQSTVRGCGNLDGRTATVTSSHGGAATATIQ